MSVDQLASPTPGLTAQITGKLTTKWRRCATMFVDQASRLGCVYLQQQPMKAVAKKALRNMPKHGVQSSKDHADNGVFRANAWVKQC